MARSITVPLASSSMEDRSRELSSERLVNFYPEVVGGDKADGRKTLHLHHCPGSKIFGSISGLTNISASINYAHDHRGTLYVSAGDFLYKVSANGVFTQVAEPGPPAGIVRMATLNNDLIVMQNGYLFVYNPDRDPVFQRVSGIPRVTHLQEMDGYLVAVRENRRQFLVSDLDAPLQWNPLNYFEAAYEADELVAAIRHMNYLLLFGHQTVEFWHGSGYSGALEQNAPFIRSGVETLERGALSTSLVSRTEDAVFFVGDDKRVYMISGGTRLTPISNYVVERKILDETPETSFTYRYYNHVWFCLRFKDTTFVYDAEYRLWHERRTRDRAWMAQQVVWCYEKNILIPSPEYGHKVGQDPSQTLTLYLGELSDKEYTDLGYYCRRSIVTPTLYFKNFKMLLRRLELDIQGGVGETLGTTHTEANYLPNSDIVLHEDLDHSEAQPFEIDSVDVFLGGRRVFIGEDHQRIEYGEYPYVMLDFSDDGGRTWSRQLRRSAGEAGQNRARLVWDNMGMFRTRTLRFRFSAPVPIRVHACEGFFEDRDLRVKGMGRHGF